MRTGRINTWIDDREFALPLSEQLLQELTKRQRTQLDQLGKKIDQASAMTSCPNPDCSEEYYLVPDQFFCDKCGTPLFAEINLRAMQRHLDYERRFLADMKQPPLMPAWVISILSDYLPKHLEEYRDEIQEFVEDGIAEQVQSGRSAKRFILWEAVNLFLLALKSKLVGLGTFRSRTIK